MCLVVLVARQYSTSIFYIFSAQTIVIVVKTLCSLAEIIFVNLFYYLIYFYYYL